ncbi:MAG TPA: hypothetical protein VG940_12465, partial [Gemmatimonadales bacterium]|nr:hypothetical protein [Gemmatimonadales bacterium]
GTVRLTADLDAGLSMRTAGSTTRYTDSTGAVIDRRADRQRLFGPRLALLGGIGWRLPSGIALGVVAGPSLSAGVSRDSAGGWRGTYLTAWSIRVRLGF